jgi:hypothetical protein
LLTTDSHFVIGYLHTRGGQPCQDYVEAATMPGDAAYAIVADGCSTGGRTDVGARVLTLATAEAIRVHWNTRRNTQDVEALSQIELQQRLKIASAMTTLGCTTDDMQATCLYVYMSTAGGFAHIRGDGVFAMVMHDGTIYMARYSWANNSPVYLVYAEDDYTKFIRLHGNDISKPRMTGEFWDYHPGKGFSQRGITHYTLGQGIGGITVPFHTQGVRYAAVFTDGAEKIEGIDWKDAVVQLLSFKTSAGEFATRRMKRVVEDAQKSGKGPLDDIGYAVIRVAPQEA